MPNSSQYRGTRRELYEIGRERRGAPRQNKVKLYFKLDDSVRAGLDGLSQYLPNLEITQSELAGLGVELLGYRLDRMAAALGRHDRILPAGVVDLEALYLIWNLEFSADRVGRGTTIYLLPEQAVRLGEIRSRLRLQIRVTQAELVNLGLTVLLTLVNRIAGDVERRTIRDEAELLAKLHDFV